MKTLPAWISIMAVMLLAAGCSVTRDVRTYDELRDAAPRTLRVMATDHSIYELTAYTVRDSMLEGSGTRTVNGQRSDFSGTLAYRDLVYIQVQQGSFWRTAAFVGVALVTWSTFSNALDDDGLAISNDTGSSCPYVYAWDGEGYALQGEAFGTSFGKALEAGTTTLLPDATARDDALLVRLTNERPETHYVNRVKLLAFETPAGVSTLADNENRAWPVTDPRPPIRSASELVRKDGTYWTAGRSAAGRDSAYRDVVELTLPHPPGATAGSVVVHAINTDLVYAAYELVFGYLGDQSLSFLYQAENDPRLIGTLKAWIRACSLTVEVWKDGRWESAGAVAPEASVTPFSRVVRIAAAAVPDDSVRVRLSSLAEMWRIDAVAVDWAPAAPLEAHALAVRSAVRDDGTTAAASLQDADADYAVMIPGEKIDMSFETYQASANSRVTYGLDVRGYLHEWPPAPAAVHCTLAFPAADGSDRVAVVNDLVRHPEVFLPLVYEYWKQRRARTAG